MPSVETVAGVACSGRLGIVAVGLVFLRTVDPTEADTFGAVVVQDFDVVAIEDGDNGAGEVSKRKRGKKEAKTSQNDYGSGRKIRLILITSRIRLCYLPSSLALSASRNCSPAFPMSIGDPHCSI